MFLKTIGTERARKLIDRELLQKNLMLLSEALGRHIQVSMVFCSYNMKRKLEPLGGGRQYLSPCYLVAYSGRYYLLCAYETPGKKDLITIH